MTAHKYVHKFDMEISEIAEEIKIPKTKKTVLYLQKTSFYAVSKVS